MSIYSTLKFWAGSECLFSLSWLQYIYARFVIFNINCCTEVEDIYSKYIFSKRERERERRPGPGCCSSKYSKEEGEKTHRTYNRDVIHP